MIEPETVDALARKAFDAADGGVVYADREPRAAGTVNVGSQEVQTERESMLVFRDEMPGANWMHPCSYALIDLDAGSVITTVRANRPPVFGLLPSSWVVVIDPDRRADLVRRED